MKSCPFCGAAGADWLYYRQLEDGLYHVHCTHCNAYGPGVTQQERAVRAAIAKWDARVEEVEE